MSIVASAFAILFVGASSLLAAQQPEIHYAAADGSPQVLTQASVMALENAPFEEALAAIKAHGQGLGTANAAWLTQARAGIAAIRKGLAVAAATPSITDHPLERDLVEAVLKNMESKGRAAARSKALGQLLTDLGRPAETRREKAAPRSKPRAGYSNGGCTWRGCI